MYLVRCVDGQTVCVPLDQGHTAEDILLSAAVRYCSVQFGCSVSALDTRQGRRSA